MTRAQDEAVATQEVLPSAPTDDRWPPQIKYIVGNEACERFSFYGMRSILAAFIAGTVVNGGLGQSPDTATSIIHTFIFAVYFMPLLGAWVSDKLVGRYHTILWVSLFYCAGHGVLACSDFVPSVQGKLGILYTGLALIAFGAGGIKPCVSAFMGDQFKSNQGHLLQKAYAAFYWSINFGSFFSFLVIPWVRDSWGYSWAFGVPGILMGLATIIFVLGTKYYVRVPPNRQVKTAGFLKVFFGTYGAQQGFSITPLINVLGSVILPFLAMILLTIVALKENLTPGVQMVGKIGLGCVILWYLLIVVSTLLGKAELKDSFWAAARDRFTESEISAARSVVPILFVFALIPVFWSLFDQTTSTWVLQGTKMVPTELFGLKIGAEQMQSANPALVMILVPLLTLVVYKRLGRFATPLRRMSLGMFFAAASYVVVAMLQARIEAGAQLSVLWQVLPYLVLTTAEVLVSTTGLEFAFREAAPQMKSTIMSFWLLTVAFGNLLVTGITKIFTGAAAGGHAESVTASRFLTYAGLTFIVAILFSFIGWRYQYRDKAAALGR